MDEMKSVEELMDIFIEKMDADTFFEECEDYGIFFENDEKIEIGK